MQELRTEYVASLPQKVILIGEHLEQQDWIVLRDDFHKLKGTGRTYGLPIITELGEVIEKICLSQIQDAPQAVPKALDLLLKVFQHYSQDPNAPPPDWKNEITELRAFLNS